MNKTRVRRLVRVVMFAVGVVVVLGLTVVVASMIHGPRRFADYFPALTGESVGEVWVQHMWEQRWMVVFALGMSVLVAVAVLPGRRRTERRGFPWFWIVFPLTCLAVAATVAVWWPDFPTVYGAGRSYMPLGGGEYAVPGMGYLSSGQRFKIDAVMIGTPIVAASGVVASVWAWRNDRY